MTARQTEAPVPSAPENAKRQRSNRVLRDRILLYLGGFELSGTASLELAAECLRRAAPDPAPEEAMRILNELLLERGLAIRDTDNPQLIPTIPPLNRKTMISGPLRPITLYDSARKLFRNFLKP